MPSNSRSFSPIEPLEARIAPAVMINNPLPDIVAGIGKTGATVDLSQLTAPTSASAYHTTVRFITNYDTDLVMPGLQAGEIDIELFDDKAPLTVQNFLAYINNANARGDFDGTFFHRAVPGFVLQGGGYEVTTPTKHIPVFPEVHNEADIVNRSNLGGTVAMAKVGGDPNSATSEWFVNLANNSANLDNQNGGFTVFGKVTGNGLTLANTIANLPLADVGLGKSTPEQNGHPITVTNVVVVPHAPAATTGLTYTVESVTPTGGTPAGLVATSVNGSTLTLNYGPGKSGTADVTVKVSDGTTSATDIFSVDVRPNFVVKLGSDMLPRFLLPGDAGTVQYDISNSGAAAGSGSVKFYLLKQTVTKNSAGQITSFSDASSTIDLISVGTVPFTLTSGKTQSFSASLKLPPTQFGADETVYRVITEVVPADTALTMEEKFSDDNKPTSVSAHDAVNKFGTLSDVNFGTRTNAVLKYPGKDAANHSGIVTWTMKGPGSGTVGFNAQHENVSLTMQGTSLTSTVTPAFSTAGSHLALQTLNFNDLIGTASLGMVDVSGLIAASGGVKTLTLGNLTGESLMLIGPVLPDNSVKAAITLGNVTDFSLESDMPITSLTVGSWIDTNGSAKDSISAPSLGTLKVKGNFDANVTLSDNVPTTAITVTGRMENATFTTMGNIGAVNVGALISSSIFAGLEARPAALADFTDARTIQSFNITGVGNDLFTNSQVAAQTLGTIKVRGVTPGTTGVDVGFIADVIKNYARAASAGHPAFAQSNLGKLNVVDGLVVDDLGDYEVKVL